MSKYSFWRSRRDEPTLLTTNADFGLMAEGLVVDLIRRETGWHVSMFVDLFPELDPGSKEFKIKNSTEGDLFITTATARRIAVEVKSSPSYQNVTIDPNEFEGSKASVLMAWTPSAPVPFWMISMDVVRRRAIPIAVDVVPAYYLVPYNLVRNYLLKWEDIS